MAVALEIGDRRWPGDALLPLLHQYGLLQQLAQQIIVDTALSDWEQSDEGRQLWNPDEEKKALQQIANQPSNLNLGAGAPPNPEAEQQRQQSLLRQIKLDRFKQFTWGNQMESYFLQRKTRLDRVIYSLLRVKDPAIAQELYFRLDGGEASFATLATDYSQGPEANTGGLIGPVDLGNCHPYIGQVLRVSQPGQLWSPTRVEDWWVIMRLEKFLPAQLDEAMSRRMLDELFSTWLQDQSRQARIVSLDPPQLQPHPAVP